MIKSIISQFIILFLISGCLIGCASHDDTDDVVIIVQQQIEQVNLVLEEMKMTDSSINDTINKLSEEIDILKTQLQIIDITIENLGNCLDETKENLDKAQESLTTEISIINIDIEELQNKNKELKEQINNLTKALNDGIDDVKNWANGIFLTISNWENFKSEIDNIIVNLITRIDRIESFVEAINSSVILLQNQVNQNTNDIKELQETIENLKNCLNNKHVVGESQVTYAWSEDYTTCTAKTICENCNGNFNETTNSEFLKDYICTAIFINEQFTTQTIDLKEVIKEKINKKKISILGDSISTCEGISNDATINSTLSSNLPRYYADDIAYETTQATCELSSWKKSYWGSVIDNLDLDLVVNNSWRGTSVSTARGASSCTSGTRATQLHADNGTEPEIVVIYIGTNDYTANTDVGTYTDVSDVYNSSTKSYVGDTSKFSLAYATMVHKVINRYKDVDVYLCNLIYDTDLGKSYNEAINKIAEEFDCHVVDFNQLVSTWSWAGHCFSDNLHPNETGMSLMADILEETIFESYKYDVKQ